MGRRRSGGLGMAMWRVAWHENCSWPTGLHVRCESVCEMGSVLGRRQRAETKERKTEEAKKARLNSKVPWLLTSSLINLATNLGLKTLFIFITFHAFTPVIHRQSSSHPDYLSKLLSHSLALVLLFCSAACWLCEELVQSYLKPWQNANVVFLLWFSYSLFAAIGLCECVFYQCLWYVVGSVPNRGQCESVCLMFWRK